MRRIQNANYLSRANVDIKDEKQGKTNTTPANYVFSPFLSTQLDAKTTQSLTDKLSEP